MKMKLTTLLFGLLLAVGWTSNASAQALPDQGLAEKLTIAVKAPPVERGEYVGISASHSHSHGTFAKQQIAPIKVAKEGVTRPINAPLRAGQMLPMKSLTRTEASALTYTWTDEGGASHTSTAVEAATDPYQMYELLKFVYTDKRFPGPYYSAYTMNDERERKVYYGAIDGGWDITGPVLNNTPINQIPDIKIVATNGGYIRIRSITVYDENNRVLTSWDYNGNYETVAIQGNNYQQYTLPLGWSADGWYFLRGYFTTGTFFTTTYYYGYITSGSDPGSITISSYLLEGHSSVRVVVNASADANNQTLNVNNLQSRTVTTSTNNGGTNYEWTINAQSYSNVEYDPDYYLPNEEGYTALMVSVKNNCILQPDDEGYSQISTFTQKSEIVNYFKNNVDSIKLLTDGLRIGAGSDYSCGTVFSCDGTYNKFFFLGKGQARQKADASRLMEIFAQHPMGEQVPFKFMFEQFSPTGGETGSQITDFYSKMLEGNVYDVVHDCASVIQNGHQFSMSGNEGTTSYAMVGLNFFIPDYRLKYWTDQYYLGEQGPYNVDGRIMNPYMTESADGDPSFNKNLMFTTPSDYVAWYAQYHQEYAPKVGIYKITLDATAQPVAYDYSEGNRNYAVTLTWVSSLNEMSGHEVPQTYTVYYFDENGTRQYLVVEGVTNTNGETGVTTLTYYVEQREHSYTIDYIVEGSPNDNEHPQFVATSNIDGVIIPGWNDFVGLQLDHHESDFVVSDMANWYRNFLIVVNEDIVNGLTLSQISGYNAEDPETPLTPMNTFSLFRYEYKGAERMPSRTKVATLTFDNPTQEKVHYTVTYENGQQILADKYQRAAMEIPDQGYVRVKGNGDLVIWPNGYHVNFKSITVKNNGTEVTSWNAETMNTLPSSWIVSPGSKWEEYTTSTSNDKVGYMEGGGYIAIPNMLNNSSYNNLTVEIEAYGDGAAVTRIAVNDDSKLIANTAGTTYTWNSLSPNAMHAPRRADGSRDIDVTDVITYQDCNTTNSYQNFSNKILNSGSIIAGNSYRGGSQNNGYNIQLRNSNPSGIVSTTSGGRRIKSIRINVASGSSDIDVYVKNTPYSSAADLYNNDTRGDRISRNGASTTITVNGDYQYFGIRARNNTVYISSILVTWETEETPVYDELITEWDYNVQGTTLTSDWTLIQPTSSDAGSGDSYNGIWIDPDGKISIPSSLVEDYEDIKVVVMYGFDPHYTGTSNGHLTVNNSDGENITSVVFHTYTWDVADASNGIIIEPSTGWLTIKSIRVYGTPKGDEPPGPDVPTEGSLLRLHLLMVDQLKAEIPDDNSHADAYEYVLRYEPEDGDAKESGTVKVDIEKTDALVNGYYSLNEIDNDTEIGINHDEGITMDVLTADVTMDLNADNPDILYFQMQGKANGLPGLDQDYLTQLQFIRNSRMYQEMLETSPNFMRQYDPEETHHYFDDSTPILTGTYNESFMSYAPSVSTWGIDRRYFENDGLNNTYGAPIWKTAVGKAEMNSVTAERQKNNSNSVNWTDENGAAASLYILDNIEAVGYLPSSNITNVVYEPYMFRVFVESKNGKLRAYETVAADPTNTDAPGEHLVGADGTTTGPICVWNGYVKFDEDGNPTDDTANGVHITNGATAGSYIFHKDKVDRPDGYDDNHNPLGPWNQDAFNAMFGALDDLATENGMIIEDDLKIFVRFYYVVKGLADGWVPGSRAQGDDPAGYGAESPGTSPSPATSVSEITFLGEIVSQTYYNIQGMQSDKPFDGVNIVVTRYSDGTTSISKVVR